MLISIVMPCRNGERYIGEAIASALVQEGVDLELVVQDGASDDGTLELVRSFGDPRIRLDSAPDGGQSEALNRAIARARGEWLLWLNADDVIVPGSLERVAPSLLEPYDLVYGDYAVLAPDGLVVNQLSSAGLTVPRILSGRAWSFTGSWLFRPRLFETVGPFDGDLHWTMDFDWILRALPRARSLHVPVELGRYRMQPEAKSMAMPRKTLSEAGRVRRHHSAGSLGLRTAAAEGQLKLAADVLSRPLRARLGGFRARRARRARRASA